MKAKIKLAIGDKTYAPGDEITQKLSPPDERFLLREGYVEREKAPGKKTAEGNKPTVKADAPARKQEENKKEE